MKFTSDKIILGWDDVESMTSMLSQYVLTCPVTGLYRDDVHLVGVARGGLVPATMVSHRTGFPMTCIHHSNRDDDVQAVFVGELKRILDHGDQTIVIIDDICDSGRTNIELLQLIEKHRPHCDDVEFIALVAKSDSLFEVDHAALTIQDDRWIQFPFEASPPIFMQ
jgi:hypoxanthine phosphoribosyltransferase